MLTALWQTCDRRCENCDRRDRRDREILYIIVFSFFIRLSRLSQFLQRLSRVCQTSVTSVTVFAAYATGLLIFTTVFATRVRGLSALATVLTNSKMVLRMRLMKTMRPKNWQGQEIWKATQSRKSPPFRPKIQSWFCPCAKAMTKFFFGQPQALQHWMLGGAGGQGIREQNL